MDSGSPTLSTGRAVECAGRLSCRSGRSPSQFPVVDNGIPVTDQLAEEVISLPMHAYLDALTQDRVIEAVRAALKP
jgi:dTDP-4-amino-4,6-dideoxygalactose transaminase